MSNSIKKKQDKNKLNDQFHIRNINQKRAMIEKTAELISMLCYACYLNRAVQNVVFVNTFSSFFNIGLFLFLLLFTAFLNFHALNCSKKHSEHEKLIDCLLNTSEKWVVRFFPIIDSINLIHFQEARKKRKEPQR